jgi:beta-glucanase (GH16 family)
MSLAKVLGNTCIPLVLSWGLAGHGQIHCISTQAVCKQSAAKLPLSDPSNTGSWIPDPAISDEFDGTNLDPDKWETNIVGWPGRPPALFVDHNVVVESGTLRITMQKEGIDRKYANLGYHDYTTGAVHSTRSVLYGYFEVRARAMKSAGSSGLWFAGKDQDNWNEIDLAEMGGKPPAHPREVYMSVHVFEKDGVRVAQNDVAAATVATDLADGFHVYGLEWNPSSIDFYIDGRLRRHLKNTSWHTPATMILDAETQLEWWGMPLDTDLPSVFTIDYVRAWTSATQSGMSATVERSRFQDRRNENGLK